MVKLKIKDESKNDKFKRIAALRTQRVLNDLRLLGNCSNKGVYSYKEEEVQRIFSAIDREFKRIKILFSKPSNVFSL
jgi:hypothetical protein